MSTPDRYTCEDMFRKLDDFLDRALTPEEERKVHEHLEICAVCASEYRFEESLLVEVKRKLRRLDTPAGLAERISDLLGRAASEDEDGA